MVLGKGILINDRWWSKEAIVKGQLIGYVSEEIEHFLRLWWDENPFLYGQTSGSTGKPKTIKLQKRFCIASAQSTLTFFGIQPEQTALLSMPAQYIAGRMMMVRAIVGQLNLITTDVSSAPKIPDRPIFLSAFTPHQMQHMLTAGHFPISSPMPFILLGGAAVSEELIQQIPAFDGGIYETYGMTETYSHVAIRQRYPINQPYFHAVPGVSFGQRQGQLSIQAPHLGQDDLITQDIVELKNQQTFLWRGRADFVVNSGGVKLFPEKIEEKLFGNIPAPFFFYGLPDPVLGQKLVMVVENTEILELEKLSSIFEKYLNKLERPKEIIFVSEMKFTKSGKLNRKLTLANRLKHN